MMPRQRCPFCQNTPRLEIERGLRAANAMLRRQVQELAARVEELTPKVCGRCYGAKGTERGCWIECSLCHGTGLP